MTEMTGGQAPVQSPKIEGIRTIVGLSDTQLGWAFDALWAESETMEVPMPAATDMPSPLPMQPLPPRLAPEL